MNNYNPGVVPGNFNLSQIQTPLEFLQAHQGYFDPIASPQLSPQSEPQQVQQLQGQIQTGDQAIAQPIRPAQSDEIPLPISSEMDIPIGAGTIDLTINIPRHEGQSIKLTINFR